MGLYDTIAQKGAAIGQAVPQVGGANGGSFAQKQQMQKNPMMKRPAMGASMGQPTPMGQPNQMSARSAMNPAMQPGGMGSRNQIQAKQLMQRNNTAMAPGGNGVTSGSYGQMVGKNPQLESLRQTGTAAGQNMGWMDKPGALQLPQEYGQEPQQSDRPQSGLNPLQSPYERQIMEQKMAANPGIQMGASQAGPAVGNYGQTMGQEMGSQDPREVLRGLNQPYGQTDVMDRGIGPSDPMQAMQAMGQPMDFNQPYQGASMQNPAAPVQMDENGLEPRRGAR